MNPAEYVAQSLAEHLTGFATQYGDEAIDSVRKPTLVVWTGEITKVNQGRADARIELWVLVPESTSRATEGKLWEALTAVTDAIDAAPADIDWSTCQRGVLGDRFPGYRIPIDLSINRKA